MEKSGKSRNKNSPLILISTYGKIEDRSRCTREN
jgi:hypothetical protein